MQLPERASTLHFARRDFGRRVPSASPNEASETYDANKSRHLAKIKQSLRNGLKRTKHLELILVGRYFDRPHQWRRTLDLQQQLPMQDTMGDVALSHFEKKDTHHLAPEDRVEERSDSEFEDDDDSSSPSSALTHPVVVSALSEETLASLTHLFETLYQEHPLQVAKKTSRDERREREYMSMSLVYGEIAFVPFKVVLDVLKRWHHVLLKPGGVFLDVGSGSGKAVFAAALVHDFDACHGIEVLEGLHSMSQQVLQRWERLIKPNFALSLQKKRTRISFTHADALAVDWPPNLDLVFLNSTCFGERLRTALARKLAQCCKKGSIIITATHKLPDTTNFVELRQLTVTQEAWGDATWYLHRRK